MLEQYILTQAVQVLKSTYGKEYHKYHYIDLFTKSDIFDDLKKKYETQTGTYAELTNMMTRDVKDMLLEQKTQKFIRGSTKKYEKKKNKKQEPETVEEIKTIPEHQRLSEFIIGTIK